MICRKQLFNKFYVLFTSIIISMERPTSNKDVIVWLLVFMLPNFVSIQILPALRSFCLYCAVGIGANFVYQATFFTACVSIDQRRAESSRNACCCCCYTHSDYTPNNCSQRSFMDTFFRDYFGPFIVLLPVKVRDYRVHRSCSSISGVRLLRFCCVLRSVCAICCVFDLR